MSDQEQLQFVYRISSLLCKYLRQEITDLETNELYAWAYGCKANLETFEELLELRPIYESLEYCLEVDEEGALRPQRDGYY